MLSPSDPNRDRRLKLQRYERFGVSEYWIVDPAGDAVEVYRLDRGSCGDPIVARPPGDLSPLRPPSLVVVQDEIFAR